MGISDRLYFAVMMRMFANIAAVNYCNMKWCKQLNRDSHNVQVSSKKAEIRKLRNDYSQRIKQSNYQYLYR